MVSVRVQIYAEYLTKYAARTYILCDALRSIARLGLRLWGNVSEATL